MPRGIPGSGPKGRKSAKAASRIPRTPKAVTVADLQKMGTELQGQQADLIRAIYAFVTGSAL